MSFGFTGRLHETFNLELWKKGNNKPNQQEVRKKHVKNER